MHYFFNICDPKHQCPIVSQHDLFRGSWSEEAKHSMRDNSVWGVPIGGGITPEAQLTDGVVAFPKKAGAWLSQMFF